MAQRGVDGFRAVSLHPPCREVILIGRQPKVGLDFWLRDVGLFRDPKFRRPRQQFGYLAPYIYECLLDILYEDKGYYIDYRDDARDDVIWRLTEQTQGRYAVTAETMAKVIDSLVACGLFSGDLFKRGFITSKRAQQGYFSATLGRSAVRVNFDIWLLSEEEMRELNPSGKSSVLQSFISWQEKRISQQETDITRQESTQRREEESRGEKNREEESRIDKSRVDESRAEENRKSSDDLADVLERVLNCRFDRNFRSELRRLEETGMQKDVFLDAAERTNKAAHGNRTGYFRVILQSYESKGVRTAADLSRVSAKRDAAQTLTADPNRPLEKWEQEWLDEVAQRRKRDKQDELN